MNRAFIADLTDQDRVDSPFMVVRKELRQSRTGKPYANLQLQDRTGSIDCRVWDDAEELVSRFEEGDFAQVQGRVQTYQGRLQIIVRSAARLDPGTIDRGEFQPRSPHDPEEMLGRLRKTMSTVRNPWLTRFVSRMFEDQELFKRFIECPAAKSIHHAYLGGLLEHTLSVVELCAAMAEHYRGRVDRDLVLVGALIHDMMKTEEFEYDGPVGYSDEGRLIGHIVAGVEKVSEVCRAIPEFPEELALRLKHMVISHHRELEHGSPKRPKTIEALILAYADDLDAKLFTFESAMADAGEGGWTSYQKIHGRYLFRGEMPVEGWSGPPGPQEGGAAARRSLGPEAKAPEPTLRGTAGGETDKPEEELTSTKQETAATQDGAGTAPQAKDDEQGATDAGQLGFFDD